MREIGRYVAHAVPRRKAEAAPDRGIFADAAARRRTTARATPATPARSPGGETHYSVLLVSEAFRGMSRRGALARGACGAGARSSPSGMHALALTLRTPEEPAA